MAEVDANTDMEYESTIIRKGKGDTGAWCVCMLGIAVLIIALPITLIFTLKKKGHSAPPNAPVPAPVPVV